MFKAIVPTVLETQLTGYVGAGEKVIRGKLWRVEYHAPAGTPAIVTVDGGEPIAFADAPDHAKKLAGEVHDFFFGGVK